MPELKFKISSALKNIIGKDLITDRNIAIFELVKNSYDAGATKVDIEFADIYGKTPKIIITDNGSGMTLEDIEEKWLFVAFSEKKIAAGREDNYRHRISRPVAGAKGIGRFSCDRLGSKLDLITKTNTADNATELKIDWRMFELDDQKEFQDISINYSLITNPIGYSNGTKLIITNLRESWSYQDLLRLRKSLLKLVNPEINQIDNFANHSSKMQIGKDEFWISISCPDEIIADSKREKNSKINGVVINDIFEQINIRTITIDVEVNPSGSALTTALFDRGQYIYKTVEKNPYGLLSNIKIKVFYMNRIAKANFTKYMGVRPVNYGSIFVYKNGFRIMPYGEPGTDFFGIDKRKPQGFARYLGTREIMGLIQVLGQNTGFEETSSRDGGFHKTNELKQFEEMFLRSVLMVLEKYVNLVKWVKPIIRDGVEDEIHPEEVVEEVFDSLINSKNKNYIEIDYGPNLIEYLNNLESKTISGSIKKIEAIANSTKDEELASNIRKIKKDTKELLKEKEAAEQKVYDISDDLEKERFEKDAIANQVFFLKDSVNTNVDNLKRGIHSIFTLSDSISKDIRYVLEKLNIEKDTDLFAILTTIKNTNDRIKKNAQYGMKGSFALNSNDVYNDLYSFIDQYLETFKTRGIKCNLVKNGENFNCYFDAVSIGIIIDNIVSNSRKAGASNLEIILSKNSNYINICFTDNGNGLNQNITDPEIIFSNGFTTTDGFGVGLYDIKNCVEEFDGTIDLDENYKEGFKITIGVKL